MIVLAYIMKCPLRKPNIWNSETAGLVKIAACREDGAPQLEDRNTLPDLTYISLSGCSHVYFISYPLYNKCVNMKRKIITYYMATS